MLRKSTSFDRKDAGWYVQNSIICKDIVPDWRLPGGGVCEKDLTDLQTAIEKAIEYTKEHIIYANNHLKKLQKIQEEQI